MWFLNLTQSRDASHRKMEELRRALAFQGDRSRARAGVKAAPADSYPHRARAHRLSEAQSRLLLLVRNGEQPRARSAQQLETSAVVQDRLASAARSACLLTETICPSAGTRAHHSLRLTPKSDDQRPAWPCGGLHSCTDHSSSRPLSSRHPECRLLPLLESVTM